MKRVAEGLTGKGSIDFFLLPRIAFILALNSGATAMFRITRGYDMQRLDDMESVAVRLASFATNSRSVHRIDADPPQLPVLLRACRGSSVKF